MLDMYESRCTELMLADAVRDLAERLAPGDGRIAQSGVELALYLLSNGASVPEAYAQTRRHMFSRLRHPSYVPCSGLHVHDGRPVDPVSSQV